MAFHRAFQRNAFQNNAFQVGIDHTISSTTVLQKPIDCVMAGDQEDEKPSTRKGRLTFKQGRAAGRALRHVFGE